MNKFIAFFLTLGLGLTAAGADIRPEKPLVTRYPAWVDSVMYWISFHKGVEDAARAFRGKIEQVPENRYTKFFQDAQREVGIQEGDILPIKIGKIEEGKPDDIAVTSTKDMCVFPENFDYLPYGAKRATAIHEALHHKYHDQTKHQWINEKLGQVIITNSCLMTIGLWALIYNNGQSRFKIAKAIATPLISLLLSGIPTGLIIVKFILPHEYVEFRADRDAMELLKCHKCAKDYARVVSSAKYLSTSEKNRYCDYYKEKKLVCKYHKNDKQEELK